MTQERISFLCKAASIFSQANVNKTHEILKSYYMMRCKVLTKGYGLPQKYFSEQARCPQCCVEWRKESETKVTPIRLSKRQKKRIKSQKKLSSKVNKEHLLHSNQIERICGFCKHITKIVVPKPRTLNTASISPQEPIKGIKTNSKNINPKLDKNKNQTFDVYSNTVQVFTLNNKKNVLKSSVKQEPKIINNNKKKRDKFAGLCQKAVLASAKLKQDKEKQNKLSLFLRPSL